MNREIPRLCLINPPHSYLKNPDAQAPLGLLYVGAAAEQAGFPVFFRNLSSIQNIHEAEIPTAEVYGVTGTVLDLPRVEEVCKILHERFSGCKTIVGGPITLSKTKINRRHVDSLIFGEGEEIIVKLLNEWPFIQPSYAASRIQDLDSLPLPARHLLAGKLGGSVFAGGKQYFGEQSTVISTSRGCPCACTFCASPSIWGRKIIYRSAESVIAEMQQVIREYGVRQFRFSDDNLTCDAKALKALCTFLEGQEIAWRASIRVLPNKIEMFEMMKRAGCVEVCFGIESGDPDVLRALQKGASVNDNRTAIVNAKKAGLAVRILFMIGTPGQTKQTVQRNIDFFESVKEHYDSIALTNFTPLPGCAIAENPAEHGCVPCDPWNLSDFNLCLYGPEGMNQWRNFILPEGMTNEEMTAAKKAMIRYVILTGKSNEG